jgi:hypothetical protein
MNRFGKRDSTGETTHRLFNGLGRTNLAQTVRRDLNMGVRSADEFIGRKPLISLSIAFILGAALGFWIKRT